MAKKTKNDIIEDLLRELNAVKPFYGIADISEMEKQAQADFLKRMGYEKQV